MTLNVFTDGASSGNPGPAGIGVVINDSNNNKIISDYEPIGEATNNVAEYKAIIKSVKLLRTLNFEFDEVNFFSDSELIVKQITGEYKVKNKDLLELNLEFRKNINNLKKKFHIKYIPREKNKEADKLSKLAVKSIIDPLLTRD